jgi:hypothetical protein
MNSHSTHRNQSVLIWLEVFPLNDLYSWILIFPDFAHRFLLGFTPGTILFLEDSGKIAGHLKKINNHAIKCKLWQNILIKQSSLIRPITDKGCYVGKGLT